MKAEIFKSIINNIQNAGEQHIETFKESSTISTDTTDALSDLCDNSITKEDTVQFYKSWLYGFLGGVVGVVFVAILVKLNIAYTNIIILKGIVLAILDFYLQKTVFASDSHTDIYSFMRYAIITIVASVLVYINIKQLSPVYYNDKAKTTKQKIKNFVIICLLGSFMQYFIFYPYNKSWVFCNKLELKQFIVSSIACIGLYFIIKYIVKYKTNEEEIKKYV